VRAHPVLVGSHHELFDLALASVFAGLAKCLFHLTELKPINTSHMSKLHGANRECGGLCLPLPSTSSSLK